MYIERVSNLSDGIGRDEAKIALALPKARTCLDALSALHQGPNWLMCDTVTLADLYAAPMFAYFQKNAGRHSDAPGVSKFVTMVDMRFWPASFQID